VPAEDEARDDRVGEQGDAPHQGHRLCVSLKSNKDEGAGYRASAEEEMRAFFGPETGS